MPDATSCTEMPATTPSTAVSGTTICTAGPAAISSWAGLATTVPWARPALVWSCASLDQRGRARLMDGDGDGVGHCDIGAYERDEAQNGPTFEVNEDDDERDGGQHADRCGAFLARPLLLAFGPGGPGDQHLDDQVVGVAHVERPGLQGHAERQTAGHDGHVVKRHALRRLIEVKRKLFQTSSTIGFEQHLRRASHRNPDRALGGQLDRGRAPPGFLHDNQKFLRR